MLETLAQVLDGKILVHIHWYRADEMRFGLNWPKNLGTPFDHFIMLLRPTRFAMSLKKTTFHEYLDRLVGI